ncbi:MAG: CHASE4 domain-containing protein [Candidatus Wallbacteria bacterium]|nr:CHASE4 domain-containing protein [Candidatus Wallbacteria bacterium]
MSLNSKVILIVSMCAVLTCSALFFVSQRIVMDGFNREERNTVANCMDRLRSFVHMEEERMRSTLQDWAFWNEAYDFVRGENPQFIPDNFSLTTFQNLNTHLVLCVSGSREVLYARLFDFAKNQEQDVSGDQSLPDQIRFLLNQCPDTAEVATGIMQYGSDHYLAAWANVRRNEGDGEPLGLMLFARVIDKSFVKELSEMTKYALTFTSAASACPTGLSGPVDHDAIHIINEHTINGCLVFDDIEGQPAFRITLELVRTSHLNGEKVFRYLAASLAVLGLVLLLVIIRFLKVFVLHRIVSLRSSVDTIRSSTDLTLRTSVPGNDEISALSCDINSMLSVIEQSTKNIAAGEQRILAVFDSVSEMILVVDRDFRVTSANNTALEFFRPEIRNKSDILTLSAFLTRYPLLYSSWAVRLKTVFDEARHHIQEDTVLMSNSPMFFLVQIAPVRDSEGVTTGACLSIRDVTEQKNLESEKLLLREKLVQAEKMESIGLLAGGVAHEINNLLMGLVTYPDLMLSSLPGDSPLREPLEIVKRCGTKASDIVHDLLSLARIDLINREMVSINQVITEFMGSSNFLDAEKRYPATRIEMQLSSDLLPVEGSAVHVWKIISNLLLNAFESIPLARAGLISVRTFNLSVSTPISGYETVPPGEYSVLEVRDNGSGIPQIDLSRIFEPFYSKKKLSRSGTGLGLTMVWGGVRAHDGFIDLRSTSDGTTFTVYLPSSGKTLKQGAEDIKIDVRGSGETVLVVDDLADQLKIAERVLQSLGYTVVTTNSGEEALRICENRSFNLVILDMIMDPGIDGLETYHGILKLHPRQKALIVSGFSETERVQEALRLGAASYLKKPYTVRDLADAVHQALHG